MSDAPATPPADPAGGDHEAIQGFWKLIAYTAAGRPLPNGDLGTVYRFVGNRFRHIRTRLGSHFKLHAQMNPKGIDFVQPSMRSTSMGIYDLDGDTLKICRAGMGRPRRRRSVTRICRWRFTPASSGNCGSSEGSKRRSPSPH